MFFYGTRYHLHLFEETLRKFVKSLKLVSGKVILEAVPHGMIADVVFANNLRIFRTPILGLTVP